MKSLESIYMAREKCFDAWQIVSGKVEIKESEIQYSGEKRKAEIVSGEICISNKIDDKHCMLFPLNYHNLDVLFFSAYFLLYSQHLHAALRFIKHRLSLCWTPFYHSFEQQ